METSQPPLLLRQQEHEVSGHRQEQQHNHHHQQQLNSGAFASSTQSPDDAPPPVSHQFPSHITSSQIVVTSLDVKGVKLIAHNVTYNRNLKVEDTDALYIGMAAVGEGAFALPYGRNSDLLFKKEGADVRVYKIKIKVPGNRSIELVSDHGILIPDELERQQDLVRRQYREEFNNKKGLEQVGFDDVLKRIRELFCMQGYTTKNKRRVGELKQAWQAEVDYQAKYFTDLHQMHSQMLNAGSEIVYDPNTGPYQRPPVYTQDLITLLHPYSFPTYSQQQPQTALDEIPHHLQSTRDIEHMSLAPRKPQANGAFFSNTGSTTEDSGPTASMGDGHGSAGQKATLEEEEWQNHDDALVEYNHAREDQFTESQRGVTGALEGLTQPVTLLGTNNNNAQQQQQPDGDLAVGKSVLIVAGESRLKKGTVKKIQRNLYTVELDDGGQEVDKRLTSLRFLD